MQEQEIFRRRDLPHWDVPGAIYFVTSCLDGSIPARGLLDLHEYSASLDGRLRPPELTSELWEERKWKLKFARADQWLDREPSVRHLADPVLAREVVDALMHFDKVRYEVYAYCVMPSHFHWVFRPLDDWIATLGDDRSPRERIMKSVKNYSARQCNLLLQTDGQFWQQESYDHWTRDLNELDRIIYYIENNPVKAGLVASPDEWPFSSAYLRKRRGK